MSHVLDIQGYPQRWFLADGADPEHLTQQLQHGRLPVTVPVQAPLPGRLVLSPRCVGGVAVLTSAVPVPVGWVPAYGPTVRTGVYLPSPVNPGPEHQGYHLAEPLDPEKVALDVARAMHERTPLRLAVADPTQDGGYQGVLVLNGATLPFAVVYAARPTDAG